MRSWLLRGQSVMPFSLRPMDAQDLDQVAAMEREAFPTLWPPTSYRRELKSRQAEYAVCIRQGEYVSASPKSPRAGVLGWWDRRHRRPVLPVQRQLVVGFVGLWFMAGEAHIVSIAVRESYRRQGLGEFLLIGAIEMGMRRGQQVLTLEARVSNESAKALYLKYGFSEVGLRRRYYSDNHEDAVVMTTPKLSTDEYTAFFTGLTSRFEERYGEATRGYL